MYLVFIHQVYGRGTGAECRHHVQKLNTVKGQIEENMSGFRLFQASHMAESGYPTDLSRPVHKTVGDQVDMFFSGYI